MMNYRANGQSTGTVTVQFQRAEDANRAYTQYNNRLIDSKRPLKIEVVVDPAAAVPAAQANGPAAGRQIKAQIAAKRGRAATRGRGGRAGSAGRAARTPKTAEDLDAEMEGLWPHGGQTDRRLHAPGELGQQRAARSILVIGSS